MTNAENTKATIAERIAENIEAQKSTASAEQARVEAMERIAAMIESDDWDGIAELIGSFKGEFGGHDLISCTTLRSNKPFLAKLMQHIVPEATDISPYANGIAFKVNGLQCDFDFCAPFFVEMDRPYSYMPSTDHAYQVIEDFGGEGFMKGTDEAWKALVESGSTDETFGYAGDKASNEQTRTFFTVAAPDYAVYFENNYSPIGRVVARMFPAKFAWKRHGAYTTVFDKVYYGVGDVRKLAETISSYVEAARAWDDTSDLVRERVSRFGIPYRTRNDNYEWAKATAEDKKRILDEAECFLCKAREFTEMWENNSEMYQAHAEWAAKQ